MQDEETRKKLRIDRLKGRTTNIELSQKTFNDPLSNDWQKEQFLKEVEKLRDTSKDYLISRVVQESKGYKTSVELFPGKVSLMNFTVKNPFPHAEFFWVDIQDPEAHFISIPEI